MINLDRLQSTLLNSGLQKTNNSLYQIINQLIAAIKDLTAAVTNIINNSGSTIITGPTNAQIAARISIRL